MPQRLVLDLNDVARVTVGASLGPFAETLFAYSRVRGVRAQLEPTSIRSQTANAAMGRDRSVARLLWLTGGVGLDLFTVVGRARGLGESRQAFLDADRDHVEEESELWSEVHQHARNLRIAPPLDGEASVVLSGLRNGTAVGRSRLLQQVEDYFRRGIEPHWVFVKNRLHEEQARLEQHLLEGGVEALLAAAGDQVRWTGSALELSRAGVLPSCTSEVALRGRGLSVVPSFYALEAQTDWPRDPTAPGLLIIPVQNRYARPSSAATASGAAGSTVLGTTRTSVLAAIARQPCSTSELARVVGITVSGASQHAKSLRDAGLIATRRDGRSVVHTITGLGEQLTAYVSR